MHLSAPFLVSNNGFFDKLSHGKNQVSKAFSALSRENLSALSATETCLLEYHNFANSQLQY